MGLFNSKSAMPSQRETLPGRAVRMQVPSEHFVNGNRLEPPFPVESELALFGMGCFWGAERIFWRQEGAYSTAVGYAYRGVLEGQVCEKPVKCRSRELLIAPDGHIHRCHRDLYSGENPIGHLLDENLRIDFKFRDCLKPACNECDVKRKNNRFQQFGTCSVEIEGL